MLEELLEALAKAPFAIDPQLEHDTLRGVACVDFSMTENRIPELQDILLASGFGAGLLEVHRAEDDSGWVRAQRDAERERSL